MALQKGMIRSRVRTVVDTETGHIQLHHPEFKKDFQPEFTIDEERNWLQEIRQSSLVKAVTPRSVTPAMLATSSGSSGVQVIGVMPDSENQVSQLIRKIKEGDGFGAQKKNEILIGRKLAGKMKLKIGSKLVLTFTDTATNIVAAAFRVAGIYQTDNTPLDEVNVYVRMNDLNELLGIGSLFHEVGILLKTDDSLEEAQMQLKARNPGLLVESWKGISPETELMVSTIGYYVYIIIGIIMLALAFGIVNTMLMAVLERTPEIGMMVALGMNHSRLFLLNLLETVFLTIIGVPLGFLMAWLAADHYHVKGIDISKIAGEAMSSFGFSSVVYPEFPVREAPTIMIIVISTALVSCIFPAIKSRRLNPVEALRR